MSAQVYWTLELEVQGGSDEFTTLMKDMVGATQTNEPGTVNYEWSTSADGAAGAAAIGAMAIGAATRRADQQWQRTRLWPSFQPEPGPAVQRQHAGSL